MQYNWNRLFEDYFKDIEMSDEDIITDDQKEQVVVDDFMDDTKYQRLLIFKIKQNDKVVNLDKIQLYINYFLEQMTFITDYSYVTVKFVPEMTVDEISRIDQFTLKYSVVDEDDSGFICFAFSYDTDDIFKIFNMILVISRFVSLGGFVLDKIYVYKSWKQPTNRDYYCMNYTDEFIDLLSGKIQIKSILPYITGIIKFSYYFITGLKPINDLYKKYPEMCSVINKSHLRSVFSEIRLMGDCHSSKEHVFCKSKKFLDRLKNQSYSLQKIIQNCNYFYWSSVTSAFYKSGSYTNKIFRPILFDTGGNDEIELSDIEIKQFDNNTKIACVFVFKPLLFKNTIYSSSYSTVPYDFVFAFVNSCVDNNSITDNHKKWRDFFTDVINVSEEEFEKMWEAKRTDEWNYMIESVESQNVLDADKIFTLAKNRFGLTHSLLEAGYILPDGSLLDFSGRHQDRRASPNRRTVDHRDIQEIEYDENDKPTGVEIDVQQFIRLGAIRIDCSSGNINLFCKPTDKQLDVIGRIARKNDGCVIIDFGDSENTDCYIEYDDGTKYQRIIADIKRYFDEGIYPPGSEHY